MNKPQHKLKRCELRIKVRIFLGCRIRQATEYAWEKGQLPSYSEAASLCSLETDAVLAGDLLQQRCHRFLCKEHPYSRSHSFLDIRKTESIAGLVIADKFAA